VKFSARKKQIWVGAYPSKRIINLLRVVHWFHTRQHRCCRGSCELCL